MPGKVDIIGSATNTSAVTVNNIRSNRKNDYYRSELTLDNSAGPVLLNVTNTAVLNNGPGGLDIVTNSVATLLVPPASEAFTYDDDGNLTTDGRWTYSWDAENRLISITANGNVPTAAKLKIEFSYDYRDRRAIKKIYTWTGAAYALQSTTKFLYDGWNLAAEIDVSNARLRNYLWGLDVNGTLHGAGGVGGLLVVSNTTSGGNFIVCDGNGSIVGMTGTGTGSLVGSYDYGPFGQIIRRSGSAAMDNPFRFSGKYYDEDTGLLYYGYRYYSDEIGRWLSRDLIGETGGLNVMCMVKNNPVNHFDAFGLENGDLWKGILNEGCTSCGNYELPPSKWGSPPNEVARCCTKEKILEGKKKLDQLFVEAKDIIKNMGVCPVPMGKEGASCINSSFEILTYFIASKKFPSCWTCRVEGRRGPFGFGQHAAIVCKSFEADGKLASDGVLYDWWGDVSNNTSNSGNSPDSFYSQYPSATGNKAGTLWAPPNYSDCSGNLWQLRPGFPPVPDQHWEVLKPGAK